MIQVVGCNRTPGANFVDVVLQAESAEEIRKSEIFKLAETAAKGCGISHPAFGFVDSICQAGSRWQRTLRATQSYDNEEEQPVSLYGNSPDRVQTFEVGSHREPPRTIAIAPMNVQQGTGIGHQSQVQSPFSIAPMNVQQGIGNATVVPAHNAR